MSLYQCETCHGAGNNGCEPCTDCYATGEVPHGSESQTFQESREEWLAKHDRSERDRRGA